MAQMTADTMTIKVICIHLRHPWINPPGLLERESVELADA
jgi:hypothetical protein